MSENNYLGLIFTGDELLYLLGLMGANYVLGIERGSAVVTNEVLNESLLEKGYVFKDFDNELILNMDVVEMLKPMAELTALVSIKCDTENEKSTVYFYSNKEGVTVNEVSSSMPEKHIVGYFEDLGKIYEIIQEKISINKKELNTDAASIELGVDLLKELNGLQGRTNIYNVLLSKGKSEAESGFVADFMSGLKDTYTIVMFSDIKNKPRNMSSCVFLVDNNSVFELVETKESIAFKPIFYKKVKENIADALSVCLHKKIETKSELFS